MEPWLSPLLNTDEMRAVDRWAIDDRGVPSLDLMENAGRAVAEAAAKEAGGSRVAVVCGKGNNGGDGLVVARLLAEMGYQADAILLWPPEEFTADAKTNLDRFPAARHVEGEDLPAALTDASVVVDAIFGTGFSGEPRDPAGAAIEAINGCDATVVATDIASGVDASTGEAEGAAVEADVTVTFHGPKLGHWIAPGKTHTGALSVAPIGIPEGAPTRAGAGLIDDSVLALPPARGAGSTKFSSGQVVIVGGSRGLTGAVCLSAGAAIRAGAGYATVAVPAELEHIFEVKLTEVMSVGCASREGKLRRAASEQIMGAVQGAAAVVLGPGIGRDDGTKDLVRELAKRIDAPLLIDADGLNAHAGRIGPLAQRGRPTVLTPHEGELGRLLETDSERVRARRLASAREAAAASGSIVVLKGDDTIVTDGDRLAVSRGGSPALATAGTGDVLSGVCGALLARGLEPFAAACAAVHAHARAGRAAARAVGATESVIAGDVIDALPVGLAP